MYTTNGGNEKSIQHDIESLELIRMYRETGDERYKDEFFTKNERLSYHVAKRFKDNRLDLDDKVSLANYGMLKAFEKFNLDKGVRFSTFSVRCMENEILMELRRLGKQKNQLSLDHAITTDKNGNNLSLIDKLESSSSNDIENYEMSEGVNAILLHLMNELDERSLVILSNMLNYDERVNQRDMAKQLGISQSYISRLMRDITKRAKSIARNMDLGYMARYNSTYSKKKSPCLKRNLNQSRQTYHS